MDRVAVSKHLERKTFPHQEMWKRVFTTRNQNWKFCPLNVSFCSWYEKIPMLSFEGRGVKNNERKLNRDFSNNSDGYSWRNARQRHCLFGKQRDVSGSFRSTGQVWWQQNDHTWDGCLAPVKSPLGKAQSRGSSPSPASSPLVHLPTHSVGGSRWRPEYFGPCHSPPVRDSDRISGSLLHWTLSRAITAIQWHLLLNFFLCVSFNIN